ncbi:4-hydroxyphenylacetate 3-monooxygenase, oxygenase component [Bacillus sp. V59.32b]|uniref:4-hydroxyphenylacetate 3-monooxygenase, oxygenase component n=1 Tax=Bacillus sp. V59.32b TaxID=1758642 RepID=UPI000E3C99F7|nr:4-hydroxyphenylacetate 3-monooxygenase, oxygenase component [Bacillus sp. V59.32b]RFU63617.1 4-hydroxyphenylacetate 3-monooxygenase, oxygenase component [Bacillus sp. V59.32b]
MPAINGEQYVERIKKLKANIWIGGKKITGDITEHYAFKGIIKSKSKLYDLQFDQAKKDIMTYSSPLMGERVGMTYLPPTSREDLEKRRLATTEWARLSGGMMGRSPDYMNTAVMALGSASDVFDGKEKFGMNIKRIYEQARENDRSFSHTFVTPQVNRSLAFFEGEGEPIAARVVKADSDGLYMKGARLIATQGGITDEIMVLPAGGKHIEDTYQYAFSIPSNTANVKFICRESFAYNDSSFDHPLGSRFEEMDTIVVFNHTLIPWERVFLYKDYNIAQSMLTNTNFLTFLLHQAVTRQVVKSELLLGTAQLMTEMIDIGEYQHVKEKISEIICGIEIMKGLLYSSEIEAKLNKRGLMVPALNPLNVAINTYPKLYPRFTEIIQLLGASGLICIPTEKDFDSSDLKPDLDLYLQGANVNAKDRVQLFRLAWDMSLSAYGGRQTLYERFFFGDSVKLSSGLYYQYNKDHAINLVNNLLKDE